MNDFQKFYPDHNCNLRLLRFATSLPTYKHLDIIVVKEKYGILGTYFMSPNQFWKHKNHIVILEAISALKEYNLNFQVVFTGSENDHRNKDYFQTLKDYVELNGIQKWTKFLGFISRADQLSLMDNAAAIIQPSLFEGWSTVVEDTKALSQFIILSDIEVHREQIDKNCIFFSTNSSNELTSIMKTVLENGVSRQSIDYSNNVTSFGKSILEVLN
ncbi:glycosyltransferase [Dyadobacter sp. NIV53]|uniref:glycosyltransferase n=1 Tax=Dyadobacter sp. NIV53 TaxID=2861765 RepID=UPI001C884663|nr:glycosyltransferase [Dyadobacter sp. NIV53]